MVVLVAVALIAGALSGVRALRAVSRGGRPTAAQYSTATVTRGTLEVTVGGTGTLVPRARQDAVSSSGGTVETVAVKAGDTVEKGQVLLTLSNDSLADQVALARLEVRLAEIDLEEATGPRESLATEADIATARAAVESARVAAEQARRNVEDLTARAPFAGTVSDINVRPGDTVPPGAPLFNVFTPGALQAVLFVPENLIDEVALGDELTVNVPAISRDLDGRVAAISAQGTSGKSGVTYSVTVTLEESDPDARGGMTASAALEADSSWPGLTTRVTGYLAYDRFQTLTTATGGSVVAVHVSEGEEVEADQVVVVLESDEAEADLTRAEADLLKAERALAELLDPGPPAMTQAQIEKVRLRYELASLQLAALERQLAELTVTAELDGTVTDVFVVPGETVAPGQRLVSVADLSEVMAVITVDELEVSGLDPGRPATVRVGAFPGGSFSGYVESVSLEGVPRDGVTSYEARIRLPGDPRMRAGMSVSATVVVARRENVLLVPVEAVYGAGREAVVQVLVDGTPVAREVTAGLSSGTFTEIIEGLEEGETVVTGSLEVDAGSFPSRRPRHPGGGG